MLDIIHEDEVLGTLRWCPDCRDEWPDDDEFFAGDSVICRACAWDRAERRRAQMREASRRLRARQAMP